MELAGPDRTVWTHVQNPRPESIHNSSDWPQYAVIAKAGYQSTRFIRFLRSSRVLFLQSYWQLAIQTPGATEEISDKPSPSTRNPTVAPPLSELGVFHPRSWVLHVNGEQQLGPPLCIPG